MDGNINRTLFFPFERGLLDWPEADDSWLFLNADGTPIIPTEFIAGIVHVQGFKPLFDWIRNSGKTVYPVTGNLEGPFGGALIRLGRHRGQNQQFLFDAVQLLKPGSSVVIAGGKKDGADSFRKRLPLDRQYIQHASKHHGIVMWFERPDDRATDFLFQPPDPKPLIEGRFETASGMFSTGRIDVGSKLLADHLPNDLKGDVADFAAGWGYLSARVLEKTSSISALDLYEADFASLEAARRNLANVGLRIETGFHWHDLASEPVGRKYDTIVMNPPFHTARKAEPDLGAQLIKTAAGSLKPGGRLLMVANQNLPYERVLQSSFRTFREITNESGFKVLVAVR